MLKTIIAAAMLLLAVTTAQAQGWQTYYPGGMMTTQPNGMGGYTQYDSSGYYATINPDGMGGYTTMDNMGGVSHTYNYDYNPIPGCLPTRQDGC